MRGAWTIGLGIGLVMLGWAKDISPDRVIKNVEKTLADAKTIRIVFEQTYHWNLTGEQNTLKGELLLEGEDRFRVTTEDQVIVSDGETLWTYSKTSERVIIDRLDNSDNTLLPRQILFQYRQDYRSRIEGEESILDRPCYMLVFTSETGDVFFTQIKAWVDKKEWIPRQIEQIDLNENRTVYLLREIQIGMPLEEETFRFTIPDGVEVIRME